MCNQKDHPTHNFIFHFQTMRLNLDVVPFSESAQSTPNVVLIYNHASRGTLLDVVQGTESTTHSPRMVNENNHTHTPISCGPRAYKMQLYHSMLMPCHTHIYGCYMEIFIHALHLASFGKLYQSTYNFQIITQIMSTYSYTHTYSPQVNTLAHTY